MAMADFDRGRGVTHTGALLNRSFVIANGILNADGMISLPKLKTHGLTRFTGAIKNQFGCVPGMLKSQFHLKLADPYEFGTMLVDLTTLLMPRLYIMDGIMAMEGNGPRSGNPRKLGVLLFATDPVALDAVACRIINLDPEFVPTSAPGERSGLGTYHLENIEVVGDKLDPFVAEDFDVVRRPPASVKTGIMRTFLRNQLCPRPVIDEALCTNCGTCVKVCSVDPKAVDWHSGDKAGHPTFNHNRCIRCFCCQEMCPEGAITIRDSLLGRLFFR
jgi:ferredoxin